MNNSAMPTKVSQQEAFRFWLKMGFISFGGPAGQIAIMHEELVVRKRWISEKRFLHALNYCMILPGPEAQQLATYLGWLMHATKGGIIAGVLFILPSLFLLMLLSWVYMAFGDQPLIASIFYGIKPAVTAIVVQAALRIGSRVLKNQLLIVISAASFVAMFFFNIPFAFIVLGAAVLGHLGGHFIPEHFSSDNSHSVTPAHQAALIDDQTRLPEHTTFHWSKSLKVIAVGLSLWLLPMLWLIHFYGWNATLTQMAWFFTKAALLTFGGAYAVLPYVYQFAVDSHHWLTPIQMIDGLALGETTPGPLIMIVTFVGFVGGYSQAVLGSDALFLSGAIAGLVATWFTFLPSFLFILIGAPIMELTHKLTKFTAPLTAITAAIVGVIVNLALFFAYFVFWPKGFEQEADRFAVLIFVLASVLLIRFKCNVMVVIFVSIGLGLLRNALLM